MNVQMQVGDREIIRVKIGQHDKAVKQRTEYDQFSPMPIPRRVPPLCARTRSWRFITRRRAIGYAGPVPSFGDHLEEISFSCPFRVIISKSETSTSTRTAHWQSHGA